MFGKVLVPLLFIGAQLIIAWYGNFTGKLPARATHLGFTYDSLLLRVLLIQLEYVWLLVLVNVLFSLGFQLGFASYHNFLVIAVLYIASGPVAALLFNAFFAKEPLDVVIILGLSLVGLGALLVVAHKEILHLLGAFGNRYLAGIGPT